VSRVKESRCPAEVVAAVAAVVRHAWHMAYREEGEAAPAPDAVFTELQMIDAWLVQVHGYQHGGRRGVGR
jgi:hypothetical protein